jgi:hypothetical protein
MGLVTIYQSTRRNISKDLNFRQQRFKYLTHHKEL